MGETNVRDFDSLEFWVGNARQAAWFFTSAFGFSVVGQAGHRTGVTDRSSYVLEQGNVRLVFTGAVGPDSAIAEYVHAHGDGIRDIAFEVGDASLAHDFAINNGATSLRAPWRDDAIDGSRRATIAAFGDCTHSLVEGARSTRPVLAQHEAVEPVGPLGPPVGLVDLDHLAISVQPDTREDWVHHYEQALGFERVHGHDERIETDSSAFNMSTVRARPGNATLVLAEPAGSVQKSQIADYLEHFGGAGVHHVAFGTADIVAAVSALRRRGLRTLDVPSTYYEEARKRLGDLDVPWEELEQLGILVDQDGEGHLLQIFTAPLGDRPTIYFEIIQREGTSGFGNENIRALYQAVARDQEPRAGR